MREIKFRAWDESNGMIYPDFPKGSLRSADILTRWTTVMQFTDLHDKNGKEIYEGDIVKAVYKGWGECWGEVVWVGCGYDVHMLQPTNDNFWDLEDDGWEVAGNIWENPELLNPSLIQ